MSILYPISFDLSTTNGTRSFGRLSSIRDDAFDKFLGLWHFGWIGALPGTANFMHVINHGQTTTTTAKLFTLIVATSFSGLLYFGKHHAHRRHPNTQLHLTFGGTGQ